MAGWMIEVETPRMGGGPSLYEVWAVWDPDQNHARALVRQSMSSPALDEKITIIGPVSESALRSMNAPIGGLVHVRTTS